jgi:hypothetical protein
MQFRPYASERTYAAADRNDNIDYQLLIARSFEIAIATAPHSSTLMQGYPVPTSKKKRACVATYRHSGD